MRSMIYFPGFELKDKAWLRIALLYFEELRPIIPDEYYARRHYLSDDAIKILDSTDLFRSYSPGYDEGQYASIAAVEEFDRYLANPHIYSYPFFQRTSINPLDKWTNPQFQTTELFSEKYSYDFERYCIENRIATQSANGIHISKELAFVYMSFLADTIAKIGDYDTFTESAKYDLILRKNDILLSDIKRFDFRIIKEQIEFYIPENISNIPLDNIIKLRNNRDFQQLRREYVQQFETFLRLKHDYPELSFDRVVSSKEDLLRLMWHSFGALVCIALSFHDYNKLKEGIFDPATGLVNLYTALGAVKSIPNLRKVIRNLQSKQRAKRYASHLSNLYKNKK